jgi:CheY-like chemotaxis protein
MRKRLHADSLNYKVLVVDDEIGIIDTLSVVLKRNGYDFTGIVDPLEAIERVRMENFDLMILDYLMYPIHGDKVVQRIREFNKEIYILLLTGHKDLAPPLETIRALDIQGYCEKERQVRPTASLGRIRYKIDLADEDDQKIQGRSE